MYAQSLHYHDKNKYLFYALQACINNAKLAERFLSTYLNEPIHNQTEN